MLLGSVPRGMQFRFRGRYYPHETDEPVLIAPAVFPAQPLEILKAWTPVTALESSGDFEIKPWGESKGTIPSNDWLSLDLKKALRGDTVLFCTGAFGAGDAIMALSPITALIDRGLKVGVVCEPGYTDAIYAGLPNVFAVPMPIRLSTLKEFKWLALLSRCWSNRVCPPQDYCLRKLGVDPRFVSPRKKRIAPPLTDEERSAIRSAFGQRIAVYAPASVEIIRSLPPRASIDLLNSLAAAFPDFTWVAACSSEQASIVTAGINAANIKAFTASSLRYLLALTNAAEVIVTPDSFLMHAAGVYQRPCIGLWGPVDPAWRVKYYPNHRALWHRHLCSKAPCYNDDLTGKCLVDGSALCRVLTTVSPEEVIAEVRKVIPV